ncbi:MAG: hypothetical protein ACD_80C00131G0004 [uncultured bacterium (gcode 4)]|uniref:Uncharacterized protein n=1 Tax=uncultured bacterium (gcode 4) TaxID=1234023 RepID=K1XIG4_9BACT|nr:MAG: hypothetical protein ACD_80C00131G0004 [uncultured bacterium (gcode 4)]
MKLLDEKLISRFRQIGEQIHTKNPLILAKFYAPWNDWEWLVSEYYPEANAFYGYVIKDGRWRWSYFSLPETVGWLQIERDTQFNECFFDI